MSVFPQTSVTLLRKIAARVTGEREAAWVRFFDLYTPAIQKFVLWHDSVHDPDDIVQDIYVKLVDVVRSGKYNAEKGSFRAFLATMIRNHLISLYRKDQSRGAGLHVTLDDVEVAVSSDVVEQIDAKWRLARHQSAIEHVLTKTAMSAKNRAVYRAYALEGRSVEDVAAAFGISKNSVSQVKTRVERMAAIVERELSDASLQGGEKGVYYSA